MLDITPIPAFADNYIWLLRGPDGRHCAVVDPGDAAPVLARLAEEDLVLSAILITHRHGDHVGGIARLRAQFPRIPVFGPANEPIADLTHRLGEGEAIELPGIGLGLSVMDVPGHTEGHIAYLAPGALFCGDTLFSVGCGRVFSGTFEQLHDALMRIRELPEATRIYCAHEYTLENIGFAKWVEPGNEALLARERDAHAQIDADRPTVPSTLAEEKATNPFLRIVEPSVIAAAERHASRPLPDSRAVFREVRTWKDREYD